MTNVVHLSPIPRRRRVARERRIAAFGRLLNSGGYDMAADYLGDDAAADVLLELRMGERRPVRRRKRGRAT